MTKPLASLSLDLDNKWSYLKVRGDSRWQDLPSYFDTVVPRILDALEDVSVRATVFVVGQDAKLSKNREPIQAIALAGHEIANHSYHHEPWLHLYSPQQIAEELQMAEDAIHEVTGAELTGFRGPGFSISEDVLSELVRRGYQYDATSFPTYLGPLARLFYFFRTRLNRQQREDRKELYGRFRDGFQTLKPHEFQATAGTLTRIPVTTLPLFKFPIHASYLLYLREFSPGLAMTYFKTAMRLCRWSKVEPSFLLHPLEFLGSDDDSDLAFFPGMNSHADVKLAFMQEILHDFCDTFNVITMAEHAANFSGTDAPTQSITLPEPPPVQTEKPVLSASVRESV